MRKELGYFVCVLALLGCGKSAQSGTPSQNPDGGVVGPGTLVTPTEPSARASERQALDAELSTVDGEDWQAEVFAATDVPWLADVVTH